MRSRLAILVAAAAVAALPSAGSAAAPKVKPQVVDAAGDAVGGVGTTDITSAVWNTTGDTVVSRVRGRKVTTYTPRKLVVTLNLAAAPTASAPLAYEAAAEVAGCGGARFTYTPGTVTGEVLGDAMFWVDCGSEPDEFGDTGTLIPNVEHKLGAKSITWTISIKTIPKEIRVGSRWTDFRAAVDVVEPAFGLYGTNNASSIDEGTGAGSWVLK